ncbi:MAG: hypothetical protein JW917_06580 [Ignavibacteria bacterium]|nr:hypothetical protein [Ignavibacteria bacterium]
MNYYRIFDDKDELNFFKSSLPYEKVMEYMRQYEKEHQVYLNKEFVEYLNKFDKEAELIEVTNIYY